MTVRTPWIDGALGDGAELREADARFGTTSVARSTKTCPGFEIQVTGDLENVLDHISEMWRSGDDEQDLELLKWVLAETKIVDVEAEARAAAREAAVARLTNAVRAYEAAEEDMIAAQAAVDALTH